MKVLFFGATGTVGQDVIPSLAREFYLILAGREAGEVDGMPVHGVDICDFEATLRFLQESGADAIVNCAIAEYRSFRSSEPEIAHKYNESTIEVNVRGAYHLYEAAERVGIKKFVFISSMTAVTGLPLYERITGTDLPRPRNFYACTKLFGEQLGEVYARKSTMSVTCLRLGQPFPINDQTDETRLSNPFARSLMAHMDDIASAIAKALYGVEAFAVYPVVSRSDVPWIDASATEDIGFTPRYFFTPDGAVLVEENEAQKS